MPYDASDLRKGLKLEIDNAPWEITEFEFCKPGKGQALYRCRLKNLITGSTMEKTYRSSEHGLEKAELEDREAHYSYAEESFFVFSDVESFEEHRVAKNVLGDKAYFLLPDALCNLLFFKGKVVEVTLPVFIEKVIVETEPGARGDTATNVTKPAKIDNGYEIQVPLFVNQGDLVRIDTRTGNYAERVKKA